MFQKSELLVNLTRSSDLLQGVKVPEQISLISIDDSMIYAALILHSKHSFL